MINDKGPTIDSGKNKLRRGNLGVFMNSEPAMLSSRNDGDSNHFRTRGDIFDHSHRVSNASAISTFYYEKSPASDEESPYNLSPWNQTSPLNKSPWASSSPTSPFERNQPIDGHIGSLVRKEGHIYSLAVSGELLYTGSDSKNIRVWKNLKEFTGFKSDSGLVKAIIISGGRIFTGHQDGKIRVWKVSQKTPSFHKHIGNLPSFTDVVKSSINPNNYVKVRRNRNVLRIKHFDAVSCMSLNEEFGLLYSGSWDRTVKVWRIADSKCLESITAHVDAINSIVSAFDGLLFTGSADGTVKVWRREFHRRRTKHFLLQVLMKQENAVTALAVNRSAGVLYAGTSDGVVNFWERKKRLSHGGVLRGHRLAVLCLASSGKLVFSGSADKSICVWRREETSGLHIGLAVLSGHTGPVKCLAVEEDHEDDDDRNSNMQADQRWIVYSGSLDKSVKVWRVSENPPELSLSLYKEK